MKKQQPLRKILSYYFLSDFHRLVHIFFSSNFGFVKTHFLLPNIVIPTPIRPMDPAYKSSLGRSNSFGSIIFTADCIQAGLLYHLLCIRNLSSKFIYCIFNTKNRSSDGFGR